MRAATLMEQAAHVSGAPLGGAARRDSKQRTRAPASRSGLQAQAGPRAAAAAEL